MTRINPKVRKKQLLDIAVELSKTKVYTSITCQEIADIAKVSHQLVLSYFKNMTRLKKIIMREAINREIPEIVAQGLGLLDIQARRAPESLKRKAIKLISKI